MIARCMLVLLLGASTVPASAQTTYPPVWTQVEALYVNTGPPRQRQGPVRATNCDWQGSCVSAGPTPGSWHLIDLAQAPWSIPANAVAVDLRGLLVITHGAVAETADMQVMFRAPGDTRIDCGNLDNLIGQAVEAAIGNGVRSGMSTWTPVIDGKIEFCWKISTPGTYPTNSAYAVNLSVQAVAVGAAPSSTSTAKTSAPAPILGLLAPNKAAPRAFPLPVQPQPRKRPAVQGWCMGSLCLQ